MPAIGESLDAILTDGPKNLRAAMIRAWSANQAWGGPWILRCDTRLSGESWTRRWKGELKAEQTRTSATAGQILAEIKNKITEGHGPAPYCDLRFVMYRSGHSKDADAIDVTRVVRPLGEGDLPPASLDPGLAVALAVRGMDLAEKTIQHQASIIAAQAATIAAGQQHQASLATSRSVGATAADIGTSLMSFAAGGALVFAWPKIRERLGLKDDEEVIDVLVSTMKGQTAAVDARARRDVKALEQRDELPVFVEEEREAVPVLPGDTDDDLPELEAEDLDDADPVLPADREALEEIERPRPIDPDALRAALLADPEAGRAAMGELLADATVLDALKVPPMLRGMVAKLGGGR